MPTRFSLPPSTLSSRTPDSLYRFFYVTEVFPVFSFIRFRPHRYAKDKMRPVATGVPWSLSLSLSLSLCVCVCVCAHDSRTHVKIAITRSMWPAGPRMELQLRLKLTIVNSLTIYLNRGVARVCCKSVRDWLTAVHQQLHTDNRWVCRRYESCCVSDACRR